MIKQREEKFLNMIKENKNDFYRLAYSHVKNEQDALDVVGESIYQALKSLPQLKEIDYMKTWFYRILINECYKVLKKNKKIVLNSQYLEVIEDTSINQDELIDLYNAIDQLSDKYKTIIILKYLKQMKIEQIAEMLKINNNTVKTRLRRGVNQLKLSMGGYTHERQIK